VLPESLMIHFPNPKFVETSLQRHLRELIDAIDRRVSHIEREGEARIATEARALRENALGRLAELAPYAADRR
jgi:hypothetical protein